jgi:hypothetical protein
LRIACFFSTFCTPPSPSASKEQPISSLIFSSLYAPSPSFLPPLLLFAAGGLFLASVKGGREKRDTTGPPARHTARTSADAIRHLRGYRNRDPCGCQETLPSRLGCSSANVLTRHPFEPF